MPEMLFSQGDVTITDQAATFGTSSYRIDMITSVSTDRAADPKIMYVAVALIVIGAIVAVVVHLAGILMTIAGFVGCAVLRWRRPWRLKIRTAVGYGVVLIHRDRGYVDQARTAIEAAMAKGR